MATSSDSAKAPQKLQGEPDTNSSTLVTELRILRKGDHVARRRLHGAYWHHGIVSDVNPKKGKLEIIGFTFYPLVKGKVRVFKRWKTFDLTKKILNRIEYDPGICYPPDVVLIRAMSQLGNTGYNLLTENCEHFARWCKTGDNISTQVESFKKLLKLNHSHPNPHHDRKYLSSTVYHVSAPSCTSKPCPNSVAIAPLTGCLSPNLSLIQTYYTKYDTSANTAKGYLHR